MTWIQLIIALISTFSAFFAALVGLLTYFERKRDRKTESNKQIAKQENEKRSKEIKDLIKGETESLITVALSESLSNYSTKEEYEVLGAKLEFKMDRLQFQLEEHFRESGISEKERIRGEILAYAEDLRNGIKKGTSTYKHISSLYDRYKSMGGNSYVDAEFDYIQKQMRE